MRYVLVHGAWQGGWTWGRVAPLLRARGHEVHAPTLTGLGERAHLLGRGLGLDDHVQDLVATLDCERLGDVVLVGHSYGGQVIATAATRRPGLIRQLIYVDAFLPDDGQCATEQQPPEIAKIYRDSVRERGFGWLLPPRSLEALGVTAAEDIQWFESLMVPHPYRTFNDPATVSAESLAIPSAYIECVAGIGVFHGQRRRAEARGWPVRELASGHQGMTTEPAALTELLCQLAER